MLLLANEFLDALPIRQLVRTAKGWRERMVGIEDDGFAFVSGPSPLDEAVPEAQRAAPVDTVIETGPAAAALVEALAQRFDVQGGAGLLVDYGHLEPRTGSTLQAVRGHQKVDVFVAPGEMDLTAHVDFATLDLVARREGYRQFADHAGGLADGDGHRPARTGTGQGVSGTRGRIARGA